MGRRAIPIISRGRAKVMTQKERLRMRVRNSRCMTSGSLFMVERRILDSLEEDVVHRGVFLLDALELE